MAAKRPARDPWYLQPGFLLGLFILFQALVIPLVWKKKELDTGQKLMVSVMMLAVSVWTLAVLLKHL